MFTSTSFSPAGLAVEVVRALSPGWLTSLGTRGTHIAIIGVHCKLKEIFEIVIINVIEQRESLFAIAVIERFMIQDMSPCLPVSLSL